MIVEGGELKTLQCIITPFLSTAEYSSQFLVRMTGGRSERDGKQRVINNLRSLEKQEGTRRVFYDEVRVLRTR